MHAPTAATPDVERTALKEWAVLVDAMARGEIVAMVRKGGIREQRAGFDVRHDRFLLYPTYFHEKAGEMAGRLVPTLDAAHARRPPDGTVRLEQVATVAAVWRVTELERLRAIEGEHGLRWGAVESRFHYRGRPEVRVVAVRVAACASRPRSPRCGAIWAACRGWSSTRGCAWTRPRPPFRTTPSPAASTASRPRSAHRATTGGERG